MTSSNPVRFRPKQCASCGDLFNPLNGRQRNCGSKSDPSSCSGKYNRRLQKEIRQPKLREYKKEWYEKNRQRLAAKSKAWYEKNREKALQMTKVRQRPYLYGKLYGITVEDYEAMLRSQGGKCAICGTTDPTSGDGRRKHFAVDHCHKSGDVRALLCLKCNLDLGVYERRGAEFAEYLSARGGKKCLAA